MIDSISGSSAFGAIAPSSRTPNRRSTPKESGNERPLDPSRSPAPREEEQGATAANDKNTLSKAEQEQVKKLQQRDVEVRTHEMAHLAAAGSLARGGPRYDYQTGPDGKSYAVGGDVQIDTSPGRNPQDTIAKAQQIRAAALAPSDPSPQDMKVAAQAARMEAEAQQKLQKGDDTPSGVEDPTQSDFGKRIDKAYGPKDTNAGLQFAAIA